MIDFDARYTVAGMRGVAFYLLGYAKEWTQERWELICDEPDCDHDSAVCYLYDEPEEIDSTDMVRAVPHDVLEKIVARIPIGRLGHASDIARGVAFLTADEAEFITGSTLSINGGQHMY